MTEMPFGDVLGWAQGAMLPCIRWGLRFPTQRGNFEGGNYGPLQSIMTPCSELCENGCTDPAVVWDAESGGPENHVLLVGSAHWRHLANTI